MRTLFEKCSSHSYNFLFFYRNYSYNIPVRFLISDTYPKEAPFCFLNLSTSNNTINISDYVDRNGKINIQKFYLWNTNESNIVQLIQMCINAFSKQFPLVEHMDYDNLNEDSEESEEDSEDDSKHDSEEDSEEGFDEDSEEVSEHCCCKHVLT